MNRNVFHLLGIFFLCLAVGCGLFIEFFYLQKPCSLCFLQRASMLMVALGLYWNLVYGTYARYYAFSFLSALLGLSCSLRHMGLNVCKPIGVDTFFFCSYRIYTWSFLVFFASLVCLSCLLFFYKQTAPISRKWQHIVGGVLGVLLVFCITSILYHRGFSF
ncbi:MAG: disulfide bond formation protein B [Verrucomicrobia bacterium]|nr:disulfide bond formation protein B [Verrucomicrobiota bacterium]